MLLVSVLDIVVWLDELVGEGILAIVETVDIVDTVVEVTEVEGTLGVPVKYNITVL